VRSCGITIDLLQAEGELSTGKIESIFFEFTNTNVSYALHDATYEKQ